MSANKSMRVSVMTTFGETFYKTCVEMMLGHAEKMMFDKYFVGG
jgi:hypothetical protein